MALFDKIFARKKVFVSESRDWGRSSQITPEQVRLLLFKECDWRGRKLLFDSSTIEKVPSNKDDKPNISQKVDAPCKLEVSDGNTYIYKGPSEDASVLGEMIFGAVAMTCKGVSFKIHIMEEPRRIMCTKVFCVPCSKRIKRVEKTTRDDASNIELTASKPVNVPSKDEMSLSFSIDKGDSGFCGDFSPTSSVSSTHDYISMLDVKDRNSSQDEIFTFKTPSGRKLSTSSNGSWQRRAFRSVATRFDLSNANSKSSCNLLSVPTATNLTSCDTQIYNNSSMSGTNDSFVSGSSVVGQRRNKLGLALLVTVTNSDEMDLVQKCLEHNPQMHALVSRVRLAVLRAGSSESFIATLYKANRNAAMWLTDMIYSPRVPPMWLTLVTSDRTQVAGKMADTLVADLCSVVAVGDNKNTNFFISTLLTHVLTYHLGWVTTVSPYDILDPQKYPQGCTQRRPYNALWAQLNDLCGSIGCPPRAAKTIITGTTNPQFVNRLLVVLTYFLRCGDVIRTDIKTEDLVFSASEKCTLNVRSESALKRTVTRANKLEDLCVQQSSSSTLVSSEVNLRRSVTQVSLSQTLSNTNNGLNENLEGASGHSSVPTIAKPVTFDDNSSDNSSISEEKEPEKVVVFVLGDNEKLVGLKNKSNDGKRVKRSSKVHNEPVSLEEIKTAEVTKEKNNNTLRETESPSKCCGQTLEHSKPIKHSGFKFDFDKYPQIVTNYMKSKNLEILDRHYIGKPGNLKLDNYQFDPMVVQPIQEEKCEICTKCQLMDATLQTPTNASEFEYMNDMPRHSEPQYAKETVVKDPEPATISPKNFIRQRKQNTIVVNITRCPKASNLESEATNKETRKYVNECDNDFRVKNVLEFRFPQHSPLKSEVKKTGFDVSLLGGVTNHYVPDFILQGTMACSQSIEPELIRDLDLTTYLNKNLDSPIQAVAIVGDTSNWEVRVLGRDCAASGMSALVGDMLEVLSAMWQAKVPAKQCLSFIEGKLREFCVLSKTLADMLMTTDFCDIATLTKSLNIDINDIPLLLAVATTHTPQIARRYGISYR